MKIIIDTNVIVSGIFFNGKPRDLLKECFDEKYEIVCTEEIFLEYIKTIEKLTEKYNKNIAKEMIPILLSNLTIIKNINNGKYSRDPDDDKFINCAKSADADYVITGDNDLLVLEIVDGIRIITVSDFLKENKL